MVLIVGGQSKEMVALNGICNSKQYENTQIRNSQFILDYFRAYFIVILLFFIEGTATGVLESTGRKSVCTKFGLLKILLYLNQVAGVGIVSSNDVRNLLRNELVLRVINLLNVKLNANI